jgi:hypothetical protein
MNPGDIFIGPEGPWDAVIGIKNFPGFPWLFGQQMLEIPVRLMEAQNEGMMDDRHVKLH